MSIRSVRIKTCDQDPAHACIECAQARKREAENMLKRTIKKRRKSRERENVTADVEGTQHRQIVTEMK